MDHPTSSPLYPYTDTPRTTVLIILIRYHPTIYIDGMCYLVKLYCTWLPHMGRLTLALCVFVLLRLELVCVSCDIVQKNHTLAHAIVSILCYHICTHSMV